VYILLIISPRFKSIFQTVKNGFFYHLVFTIIALLVGILSRSYGLLMSGLLSLIFLTDLSILFIIKNVYEKNGGIRESLSRMYFIIYIVEFFIILIVGILLFASFGIFSMVYDYPSVGPFFKQISSIVYVGELSYPILAFFTPILLLLANWYLFGELTRKAVSQHEVVGNTFYDTYTMMIIAYSVALFGITLSILTIYWLELAMGILLFFVAFYTSIKRVLVCKRNLKIEMIKFLENSLKSIYTEVPVILNVNFRKATKILNFILVDLEVNVSPVISGEDIEIIAEYLTSRSIEIIPNIVLLRFKISYLEEGTIKVAVSLADGNRLEVFEKSKNIKIYEVKLPSLEIIGEESMEIKGISEELDFVKLVEELIRRGVNSIITIDMNEISKNAFDGWFVEIVKTKTYEVDKEVKKYLASIVRKE